MDQTGIRILGTGVHERPGVDVDSYDYIMSDYLTYDKDTLRTIADSGDVKALYVASLRSDWFSLDEREEFVLAAAKRGELSGLIRMFFEYFPDEDSNKDGDAVKAYGYLLAAQRLAAPDVEKVDFNASDDLPEAELREARLVADKLVTEINGD